MQLFELYQIFHPIELFNSKEQLEKLKKYMVLPAPITQPTPLQQPALITQPTIKPSKQPTPLPKTSFISHFTPFLKITQPNSLFWGIYTLINGPRSIPHPSKLANEELREHGTILAWLKSNPSALKQTFPKLTKALCEEIYSDLLIGKTNNPLLIYAYCVYYHRCIVVFISNKAYCQYGIMTEDETPLYVYLNEEKRYNICYQNELLYPGYQTTLLAIEKVGEPLKTITHYKVADLTEIAAKLDLKLPDKAKKAQIYDAILVNLA